MPKALKILIGILIILITSVVLLVYFRTRQQLEYVKNESSELIEPTVSTLYFPVYIAVDDLQKLANKKQNTKKKQQIVGFKTNKTIIQLLKTYRLLQ